MKKFFTCIALLVAVAAPAQLTNGVKDSALATASTVNSVDRVRILQLNAGTNQNLTATVGQITLAATAIGNAAQTYAVGASNALTTALIASNAIVSAANAAASNTITAALVASNALAASANAATSNALAALRANTNSFYAATNPNGYQTGGQVSSTVNSAITAATLGTTTNGGAVAFSTVTLTNLVIPTAVFATATVAAGTNIFLDCSKANFFQLPLFYSGGGWDCKIGLTNWTDGQQINCIIKILSGSSASGTLSSKTTDPTGGSIYGTAVNQQGTAAGQTWYFNWVTLGTNLVFSGGKL